VRTGNIAKVDEGFMKLYCFDESSKNSRTVKLFNYETDESFFLNEFSKIEKGWTVVDVGSEYGYYAIRAGLLVGNEGKVMAIEPHPATFQLLKKNMRLHRVTDRVIAVNKAASNKTGKGKLFETFLDPGGASIAPRRGLYDWDKARLRRLLGFIKDGSIFKLISSKFVQTNYEVPIDTLDKIIQENNLEKIDLIKVDVEGAEFDVLNGAISTLRKDKPILLIEVHHGCVWKPETLYQFLRDFGYALSLEKRAIKTLVAASF
jgi:FkbM family methyltransferase